MKSRTTRNFRKAFASLPDNVKNQARSCYRLFKENPWHPGLQLKRVHQVLLLYSVRIGIDYRALGQKSGDEIIWFWIGSHSDYNKLL